MDFPGAKESYPSELRDLLEMAVTDLEPHQSTEILLKYKLKDKLNPGQIRNLSHEMADDNEAEDNPDTALHYTLFNINQLLRKSYNGIFPNSKATKMVIELFFDEDKEIKLTKELALKSIGKVLSNKSPLIRLFEGQLNGKEPFRDAENVIWELNPAGKNEFVIITSDYWINDEDINEYEISDSIKKYEVPKKPTNGSN